MDKAARRSSLGLAAQSMPEASIPSNSGMARVTRKGLKNNGYWSSKLDNTAGGEHILTPRSLRCAYGCVPSRVPIHSFYLIDSLDSARQSTWAQLRIPILYARRLGRGLGAQITERIDIDVLSSHSHHLRTDLPRLQACPQMPMIVQGLTC
ncbi:hypothetical protein BDV10DRAFT_161669 [Aspergillus recurvatus]